MIQGGIRRVLIEVVRALPETPPAAADIPVTQVVQKGINGQRRTVHVRLFQTLRAIRRHLIQARYNPGVERIVTRRRRPLRIGRYEVLVAWFPAVKVGIGDEEVVHVPEWDQKLPPYLIGALVAKQQIVLRLMRTVEPAHDIDTHTTRR